MRGRDVLELVGGSIDDVRPRLGKLHEALGLAPLLDRSIGDCSGGMRQRIAIAAAFVGGHSLVILDEPFNWLDPVAIFDLCEVLRDIVDSALTLITVLHDLGTLASACDAGLMPADGKVALALDEGAADRGPEPSGVRATDDRPPAIRISRVGRLAYAQKEILR